MTDTPAYDSAANPRRRVLLAAAVLGVLVLAGGTYGLWALQTTPERAEFGSNDTLTAAFADAPASLSEAESEAAFVVRHTGGSAIDYRSLRLVVYRNATPIRTLESPQWRDTSLVAHENESVPPAFGTFAPGDTIRVVETDAENSGLESGGTYLLTLVDTDSGRRVAAARVTLH
ncbi:hypothetical protein [Salarchaeum sp. JOR-1]|uniref:hypothetical protein n=1 Tax=Salarchaeum sp. JOR-1 TaxID=2599399 RepID=UPI0011988CF8|nr:hypothetical protein [Salarchaeum sp. JOR-1]QDX39599.1 hypothetical protein FQU85_01345 [Salarchaeum sp. JOR-1]